MSAIREQMEALLDQLEQAPPLPDRLGTPAQITLPVIHQGKEINTATIPVAPIDEREHHVRSVRALREALQSGDDPWRIALLALQVGGGTWLPLEIAVSNRRYKNRQGGLKNRIPIEDDAIVAALLELRARGMQWTPATDQVAATFTKRGQKITGRTVRRRAKAIAW